MGQLIFRFMEVVEFASPTPSIQNQYLHIQSISMFVFGSQMLYMLTTNVYFHSEKIEIARHYVGELCDVMLFYQTQKMVCSMSYLVALLLKQYNLYIYYQNEIIIFARQHNIKIIDGVR